VEDIVEEKSDLITSRELKKERRKKKDRKRENRRERK